jgi:hypothetical protein
MIAGVVRPSGGWHGSMKPEDLRYRLFQGVQEQQTSNPDGLTLVTPQPLHSASFGAVCSYSQ